MGKLIKVILLSSLLITGGLSSLLLARVVEDHQGNRIEVPDQIDRLAVIGPLPLASVVACYQGGRADNIVATSPDAVNAARRSIIRRYAPDLLKVSDRYGRESSMNMEELLRLKPQVVLYHNTATKELFEKAGIPAVAMAHPNWGGNESPLATLEAWLNVLSQLLDSPNHMAGILEKGRQWEADVRQRVASIAEDKMARVLIVLDVTPSALTVAKRRSFGAWWCDVTRSVNVALDAQAKSVNMEQIYEWKPDVILLTSFNGLYPEDLYDNGDGRDWSSVPAVKNRRVYKFPLGMHRGFAPSADTPWVVLWAAKAIYPDLFTDVDMPSTIREYYKTFYRMELSDDEVAAILRPDRGFRRGGWKE